MKKSVYEIMKKQTEKALEGMQLELDRKSVV